VNILEKKFLVVGTKVVGTFTGRKGKSLGQWPDALNHSTFVKVCWDGNKEDRCSIPKAR
jgi:hypothetical protein